jgi:hypothetical protein
VIHFFWDRILGTYRRPDARFRGQKGFPNQLVSDSKPHLLSRSDLELSAPWKSLYGVPQIVANPASNMTPSTVGSLPRGNSGRHARRKSAKCCTSPRDPLRAATSMQLSSSGWTCS